MVELSAAQLEELLVQLAKLLPPELYQLVEKLLRTLQWVLGVLQAKEMSLGRLRRMIFGAKTETSRNLLAAVGGGTAASDSKPKPKAKGHGRHAAQDYSGAQRQPVPHPKLHVGDLCPKCLKGKLYLLKIPARIVRVVAQPIFRATVFELERLRCALCGALFTAPAPPEAGPGKYDPSCGVRLNLQRFGAGQPMYRPAKWQRYFGVPLPTATQWELMAAASKVPALVYEALIRFAAQAELLHNDDTPMRVQSLRREIAATRTRTSGRAFSPPASSPRSVRSPSPGSSPARSRPGKTSTSYSRIERLTWPSRSRCVMRFPAMSPRTFKP